MSEDSFSETSYESWGSRLGGSCMGAIIGLVLIVVGIGVLFWNEGRAIQLAKSLAEGAAEVVTVSADKVEAGNEGKEVHLSGPCKFSGAVQDPQTGVSIEAAVLSRQVEMYQWKETSHSTTDKHIGGGESTRTTYDYDRQWSSQFINSHDFKHPADHTNPARMPMTASKFVAAPLHVGEFELSSELADKISPDEPVMLTTPQAAAAAKILKGKVSLSDGMLYISATSAAGSGTSDAGNLEASDPVVGQAPATPQIGDVRITYKVAKPATLSIVAQQVGGKLAPFATSAGGTIALVEAGTQSAEAMFKHEEHRANVLCWALRGGGFAALFIGLLLLGSPLTTFLDVLPFLGSLAGVGIGAMAFVLALAGSLITIAIGYITYRPTLFWGLIGGAMIVIALCISRGSGKKNAKAQSSTPPPVQP